MKLLSHSSAKPSHYNKAAKHYDKFNEENSQTINRTVENILKKNKVKAVFDMTCGTGSQVFFIAKRGYKVVGSDINSKMLKVAKTKAKKAGLNVKFLKGDMRTIKAGTFDAAITIFNAVGHLTKSDFEKAMRNIKRNLKKGGLYIFDINNLNHLLKDNNITTLTIDWQKVNGTTKIRDVQYSTISKNGILASYTTHFKQTGANKPKVSQSSQTLQIYNAKQLREMLQRNGFKVLENCGTDGSKISDSITERILTVARKQ